MVFYMQKNTELKVELLQHNAEPEMIAALAAKLCYSGAELSDLKEKVSSSEQTNFIQKLIGMGHFSVFWHRGCIPRLNSSACSPQGCKLFSKISALRESWRNFSIYYSSHNK